MSEKLVKVQSFDQNKWFFVDTQVEDSRTDKMIVINAVSLFTPTSLGQWGRDEGGSNVEKAVEFATGKGMCTEVKDTSCKVGYNL